MNRLINPPPDQGRIVTLPIRLFAWHRRRQTWIVARYPTGGSRCSSLTHMGLTPIGMVLAVKVRVELSATYKKLFIILGIGILILIGSSVGSAVVKQIGIVPDSLEWRGFYSPHNPATLEGGIHLWPFSANNQPCYRPDRTPSFPSFR